jgi:hypothetical protein
MIDSCLNIGVKRHVERAALRAKDRFYCRQILQILGRGSETGLNLKLVKTDHIKLIRVTQMRDSRLRFRSNGSMYLRRDRP